MCGTLVSVLQNLVRFLVAKFLLTLSTHLSPFLQFLPKHIWFFLLMGHTLKFFFAQTYFSTVKKRRCVFACYSMLKKKILSYSVLFKKS